MSTIVVIKLSVTSRKYFLVFNNGSRARFHMEVFGLEKDCTYRDL